MKVATRETKDRRFGRWFDTDGQPIQGDPAEVSPRFLVAKAKNSRFVKRMASLQKQQRRKVKQGDIAVLNAMGSDACAYAVFLDFVGLEDEAGNELDGEEFELRRQIYQFDDTVQEIVDTASMHICWGVEQDEDEDDEPDTGK